MNHEVKNTFTEDSDYPYLLFLQDRGWKYQEESEKKAAYQREVLVRQNKILNEEEFVAETGKQYADAARTLYPKLAALARAGKITPWDLFHYAQHLWCMKDPDALIYVQIGANSWAVNSCDTKISVGRALEIVCREWGFEKSQVLIQAPAYYESTDWNYIRFRCGPLNWVMHDGELHQQYN